MKKYNLLLFDLDDTLLDSKKTEEKAFYQIYSLYNLLTPYKMLFQQYKEINLSLWKKLEKNQITVQELKVKRWQTLLDKNKIESINVEDISSNYLDSFIKMSSLLPGVDNTIFQLSKSYTLSILTNGFYDVQIKRLKQTNLSLYFSKLISPEKSFACKPSKKIFQRALDEHPQFDKNEILMIGDNLYTDILGAKRVDIDSCLISSTPLSHKKSSLHPNYHIKSILELEKILR